MKLRGNWQEEIYLEIADNSTEKNPILDHLTNY